jgi:hypothetical protein
MRCAVAGAFITCLLLSPSATAAPAMVANPTGKGDPDALTCRKPQSVRSEMAMRIVHDAPTICHTNRFWADLIKSHIALWQKLEWAIPRDFDVEIHTQHTSELEMLDDVGYSDRQLSKRR